MRRRCVLGTMLGCALTVGWTAVLAADEWTVGWTPHTMQQLNGIDPNVSLAAQSQVPSSAWNRYMWESHIVYMPETNRLLIGTVVDDPQRVAGLYSDNFGATWNDSSYLPAMTGLTYLGNGKVWASSGSRWLSADYGQTWEAIASFPSLPDGRPFYQWDPPLVDKNGAGSIVRMAEAGYTPSAIQGGPTLGHIRFSTDGGRTWPETIAVPQWVGVSEVSLARAGNGDIIAACRTDATQSGYPPDYYCGLGASISKDNGATWSTVNKLYDYGRHHPSMVVMPNDDVVMTYVVRLGYENAATGCPQFGIEAVVSHDDGQTWDLDHRYILDQWTGNQLATGENSWWGSPCSTSTSLLPDGSLLTLFGTGFRATEAVGVDNCPTPRDLKLVHWQLNEVPEPSALVLAFTGLLALTGYYWQKNKSARM